MKKQVGTEVDTYISKRSMVSVGLLCSSDLRDVPKFTADDKIMFFALFSIWLEKAKFEPQNYFIRWTARFTQTILLTVLKFSDIQTRIWTRVTKLDVRQSLSMLWEGLL